MKKLLTLTIALVLALSLAACGGNNSGGANGGDNSQAGATDNGAAADQSTGTDGSVQTATGSESGNVAPLPDGWPSDWPGDVTPITGTFIKSGGDLHDAASGGLSVTVKVTDVGVYRSWVDSRVSDGYVKVTDMDTGGGNLSVTMGSDKYLVMCSFLAGDNLVTIGVTAI